MNRTAFLWMMLLPVCAGAAVWSHQSRGYTLKWDVSADAARVVQDGSGKPVWQGPLLPAFWLQLADGTKRFVKAEAASEPAAGALALRLADLGTGELRFRAEPWGVRFEQLRVTWNAAPPAIIGLYYGAAPLTDEQRTIVPSLDLPFWPAWGYEGFSIPSAKGGPVQSFFRNWDLGHATIPLGSFGPSLGTPYAAAYPRPLFSAALGGAAGWVAIGPGSIPDAALTFEIRATLGSLHYLYREDLWGAPAGATRVWSEPLRLAWAPAAWDAYHELFASFGPVKPAAPLHQRSHWNTWGNFKERHFDLRLEADRAAGMGTSLLVIDDGWESANGSGIPDLKRYPNFAADLDYIRSKGLEIGFWLTAGWVVDVDAAGLTRDDLLVGKDGRPRRAAWNMAPDSLAGSKLCLDPSSPRTREFLRTRVQRIMRNYNPQVLKLDFGYGLPGPDVSAPRNPEFRGERLAVELLKITAQAAREVNPDVTIQYYGIHPLMRPVTDVVALDDLGDAGGYEAEAHNQWSVWSALAAAHGVAIMASSGYDWKADSEVLLDTAVIGAPGAVLPTAGPKLDPQQVARRKALARWYRRTTGWEPLWLNSEKGALGAEPRMRCFGRMENGALTALALRNEKPDAAGPLRGMQWEGRWALISQDAASIFDTRRLALVPFDGGSIEVPLAARPRRVLALRDGREEPYEGWSYTGGTLRLEASRESGFAVER
ncbi:MAG: hypothetical protein ACM336_08450 [Acidobacteriota bacterium]